VIKGLQAGFRASIPGDVMRLVDLGVQAVRLDCQTLDAETTRRYTDQAYAYGLIPLVIVNTLTQLELLPRGTNVEWRNEPDLTIGSPGEIVPAHYHWEVLAFAAACERLGLFPWAGVVSNLNARGFTYLRDARVDEWPAFVSVSVHRYPNDGGPTVPHRGYRSREHEVEALRALIGHTRPWGVSEFGYHTGNRASSWLEQRLGIARCWTEQQQADYAAWEWSFWAAQGARGAIWFQIGNGPTSVLPCRRRHYEDCFGIYRLDGTKRPVADTFRGN
jgi:hypothetical protein